MQKTFLIVSNDVQSSPKQCSKGRQMCDNSNYRNLTNTLKNFSFYTFGWDKENVKKHVFLILINPLTPLSTK